MNELTIFNNPSYGEIRAVTINDEPWFVASDVCKALEIANTTQAVQRLDEDEKSMLNIGLTGGATNCVNEYGLYNLVLASRKQVAKDFKRWITHEVLPSIRKTGSYTNRPERIRLDEQIDSVIRVMHELRVDELSKITMFDKFYRSYNIPTDFLPQYVSAERIASSATDLLQKNGFEMSAMAFNKLLEKYGYLETRERASSKGGTKKFKSVTEKGDYYGKNTINMKNPHETQPFWFEDTFVELYQIVTE